MWKRTIGIVVFCTLVAAIGCAQAEPPVSGQQAWQVGWPGLAGPRGSFQALPTTTPLLEDITLGRLAWRSESKDLGCGKGGGPHSRTAEDLLNMYGPDRVRWRGSLTPPIVADGTVYVSSYRPAGPFYSIGGIKGNGYSKGKGFDGQIKLQVQAEDILVAMDAETGKTRWTFAEPGKLMWQPGKRGGLQMAPRYHDGRVYFVGTLGDLYAIDAKTGKKVWQNDIGGAARWMRLLRQAYLHGKVDHEDKHTRRSLRKLKYPGIDKGLWIEPPAPLWMGGIVIADGVLVVGDSGTGLRGHDLKTGKPIWQRGNVISYYAAPSVWTHKGRQYLLTATANEASGSLQLLDAKTGKTIWQVKDLGPTFPTLAASEKYVLVNTKKYEKHKQDYGTWGCYELSLTGAKLLWELPNKPGYRIPLTPDSNARQRYTIRGDTAYVETGSEKKNPRGRFLVIDAPSGKILAEHVNSSDMTSITRAWYLLGDRIYAAYDRYHSPNRGGRKPFIAYEVSRKQIRRVDDEVGICALDMADITGGYRVTMESAFVDGRIFERTTDGGVVCYDIRRGQNEQRYRLEASGLWRGVQRAMPIELRIGDGAVLAAKVYPPTNREVGQPTSTGHRYDFWRDFPVDQLKFTDSGIAGNASLDMADGRMPVTLHIRRQGNTLSGTWTRTVPAKKGLAPLKGQLSGQRSTRHRFSPTPWLKHSPRLNWYSLGKGQECIVLGLEGGARSSRGSHQSLTVSLVYDGKRFIAGSGSAFRISQGWHEVDTANLRYDNGRLTGSMVVILHCDMYGTQVRGDEPGNLAGRIEIDASVQGNAVTGSFVAQWGVAYQAEGKLTGQASSSE